MIYFEEVVTIHNLAIESFGGKNNIRDTALLESALNRPFATFDGIDLYPTLIEKAAALAESIIKNHPFHDGNKRIGYVILIAILIRNNIDINHKNLYFLILNLCFNLFFNFVFISVNWNNKYTQ